MSINVDLGAVLETYVDNLVDTGVYPSRDAVVRDALRLVQDRAIRLAEIEAGDRPGLADADAGRLETVDEVRAHLQETFAGMAKTSAPA